MEVGPFYALWIPILRTHNLYLTEVRETSKDLSDTGEPFVVKAIIDEDFNINFFFEDELAVSINCYFSNENGYLLYKLNSLESSKNIIFDIFKRKMPTAIYHLIKDFFHEHIFHSKNEDSLLVPYFSIDYIDPKQMEAVYKYYLDQYFNKIFNYKVEILNNEDKLVKCLSKSITYNKGLYILYPGIKKMCEKAKGEYNYCKFLLSVSDKYTTCENLDVRIEQSMFSIDFIQSNIDFSFLFESSKLSLKIGALGVLVGFIGIVIGFISIL